MSRPTWDETWLKVAETVAKRSKCRKGVGAVVVDGHNRPVATGYNGPPARLDTAEGQEGCEAFCPRARAAEAGSKRDPDYLDCVSVHAELNALLFADRREYEGGTLYVTTAPCFTCAKAVANSGISRVVLARTEPREHRDPVQSIELLRSSGVEVREV